MYYGNKIIFLALLLQGFVTAFLFACCQRRALDFRAEGMYTDINIRFWHTAGAEPKTYLMKLNSPFCVLWATGRLAPGNSRLC
jgi:hypothetical protein